MSNCGPDIVKYFIVTPLTGDTYVIGGVNTPATNKSITNWVKKHYQLDKELDTLRPIDSFLSFRY